MGNGSSQSVVLSSPQRAVVFNSKAYAHYQRRSNRYATPENKVLPRPVAGQRLRPTENGNILHSAGTIRGQRSQESVYHEEDSSEFVGLLRRKDKDTDDGHRGHLANGYQIPLRDQRMFLSEPDITRSALYHTGANQRPTGLRKSVVAESPSKSKIKSKKKARAPDPPSSTLSTGTDGGGPQPSSDRTITTGAAKIGGQKVKGTKGEVSGKGKAPPPPPPPLPNTQNGTGLSGKGSIARSQGFEKNLRAVDRWKLSRSALDITCSSDRSREDPALSRTTVFDSKTYLPKDPSKKPALVTGLPSSRHSDAFQKEISAITKKIAEGQKKVSEDIREPSKSSGDQGEKEKKQYYFSDDAGGLAPRDPSAMRKRNEGDKKNKIGAARSTKYREPTNSSSGNNSTTDPSDVSGEACVEEFRRKHPPGYLQRGAREGKMSLKTDGKTCQTRNPPQSLPPPKTSSGQQGSTNSSDVDPDIDIHLRPILPRRSINAPHFSPNEIWQEIGVGSVSDSPRMPSSSEDGETREAPVRRLTRPVAPKKFGGQDYWKDVGTSVGAKGGNSVCENGNTGIGDSLWTPRHDLQDDSDGSSVEGEVVLPKGNGRVANIPVKFAFPTNIFTSSKQMNSTNDLQKTVNNDDPAYAESRSKGRRKKPSKRSDVTPVPKEYFNTITNLKKLLRMRSRYLLEEDVLGLDSNWSLGSHTPDKKNGEYFKGQQRKSGKYGLIVPARNGGYVQDITVTATGKNEIEKYANDELRPATNSNFSFYSTEGHVIYLPKKDSNNLSSDDGRNTDREAFCGKGKKLYLNRKSECSAAQLAAMDSDPPSRRILSDDLNEQKKEVIRFIEEEVRKRCLIEKMHLRQQLQLLSTKAEEDVTSDEIVSDLSGKDRPSQSSYEGVYNEDPTYSQSMSHWKSSPALLEGALSSPNERQPQRDDTWSSSSSITSLDLLDPETWKDPRTVDDWLQRQTNKSKENSSGPPRPEPEGGRSSSDEYRMASENRRLHGFRDEVGDKGKNAYRRLEETVQHEDHSRPPLGWKNDILARRHRANSASYSSPWSGSEESSSPNSVGERVSNGWHVSPVHPLCNGHARRDLPTKRDSVPNSELSSGYSDRLHPSPTIGERSARNRNEPMKPTFQVTFVQPFTPSKGYRPVPFRATALSTGVNGC